MHRGQVRTGVRNVFKQHSFSARDSAGPRRVRVQPGEDAGGRRGGRHMTLVGGKLTFGSICDKNTLAIRFVQQISLQGLESTVFVIL